METKQFKDTNGGGLYRGTKGKVKVQTLNIAIAVLFVALIASILFLSSVGGFTITYQTNGGNVIDSSIYKYGEEMNEEIASRAGYTFIGWYLDEELTIPLTSLSVEESITLYACYKANEYTVTFDSDGGILTIENVVVIYDETYGTLPIPTKEGYSFVGWELNGQQIEETTIVSLNGDHTLVAIYE